MQDRTAGQLGPAASRGNPTTLAVAFIAFLATLTAGLLGSRLAIDRVDLVALPAGVAAGLLLATSGNERVAAAVGIVIGLGLGSALAAPGAGASPVATAAVLAQSLMVAWAAERSIGAPVRLGRPRDVTVFLLVAASVTALAGGPASLAVAWNGTVNSVGEHWLAWTLSHGLGVATIAPAFLVSASGKQLKRIAAPEHIVWSAAVAAASLAAIGATVPDLDQRALLTLVVLLPVVIWVALDSSAARAALALLVITVVVLVRTRLGTGVFAPTPELAQLFLAGLAVLLLGIGALRSDASPGELRSWRVPFRWLRTAGVVAPLLLLGVAAARIWNGVEADAKSRVGRVASSIEEHAQRMLEVHGTILEAALARARSVGLDDIARDADLHAFLARLEQHATSSSSVALIDPRDGTVLSWSRVFPAPARKEVARDYWRAHARDGHELWIGEVFRTQTEGSVGFTISRRDMKTGLIAVSVLPIEAFQAYYGSLREGMRDVFAMVRDDGALLAHFPPDANLVGMRLPPYSVSMRFARGEIGGPMTARAAIDNVERMFVVRRVSGQPAIMVLYGLDYGRVRAAWLAQVAPLGAVSLLAAAMLYGLSRSAERSARAQRRAELDAEAQRVRAEEAEALVESRERLAIATTAARLGHFEIDWIGRRWDWSPDLRAMMRAPAGYDVAGDARIVERVLPDAATRTRYRERLAASLDPASSGEIEDELEVLRLDGTRAFLMLRGKTFFETASGRARAARTIGVMMDITDRRRAEEGLEHANRAMVLAAEAGGLGTWHLDVETDRLDYSDEMLRVLGLDRSTWGGSPDALEAIVHPGDVAARRRARESALAAGARMMLDFRIVRPTDGAVRWLHSRGNIRRGEDGSAVEAYGIMLDVTEAKETEARLAESEERYRFIVENTSDHVFRIGLRRPLPLSAPIEEQVDWIFREGYVAAANDGFARSYGAEHAGELIDKPFERLVPRSPVNETMLRRIAAGRHRCIEERLETRATDGSRRVFLNTIVGRICDDHLVDYMGTARDITLQVEAEEALQKSRAFLQRITDIAPAILYVYDIRHGRCLWINQSVSGLLGYSADDILRMGEEMLPTLMHPEDLTRYSVHLERLAGLAAGEAASFEYRMRTRQGTWRWFESDDMVYERDVDGNVTSIVGAAHEISERKAREEQVQLLMREVNHRAKNLLGVVQVIARQTAATDAQSFAERFGERVMALAASQDLLVENEWRGVDLGDLVRSQLEHMADLVGERIKLDGPPLRVSAAAAQNIGMTLHELATNAGKYGALSCPNGRVEVAWRLAGTPPEDRLTIGWIERGGPPVAPPGRRGFGSTVIDEMVRRSLGAEVSFTLGPDGAEWHMDCLAANALEVAHPPEPVNPRVDPGPTEYEVPAGSSGRPRDNHNQLWKTVAS